MRDWTNESLLHVAEVNVKVLSAGWTPGFCHVLREDVARLNALHEHRAKVTNQRRNEILRLESVCTANRSRFLSQRTKDTADDLGLTVKINEPFFDESCQL